MSTPQSPFQDHASPILQGEPTINDQQRSELWDTFHQSKDPNELVQKLTPLAIPDDLKHKLFQAKQTSMPAPPPVDKVTEAVQKMVALDPKVLDVAEAHPNLLKAFTTAATTEPKAPAEPAAASAPAGKGKTASAAPKTPLTPRADGQPHFPPIPDGHHRVLSSNGGVYDVPQENIDKAREADPNLHVLNP
jgi:hypothetical protein